ncbi:MAG TPA: hypothetical protein VJ978_12770 [Nitriliruptoraceae bacterium]|nr:hypothetical protein [Nitriliruptoraceae bacterium]
MSEQPSFSERTALSDARTASSTVVLVLVVSIRAIGAPFPTFAWVLLGMGMLAGVIALWEAGSRYVWREDEDHRTPRPWAAFTAAISILCSCLAGLSLTFQDLPDVILDFAQL